MLHILHLDQSEFFRGVMRDMLNRCGHSCVSVSGMTEALSEIHGCSFDLMLTSLEFRDGSVESLLQVMNGVDCREIPIVVITSTDSIQLREKLFALGVAGYLLKGEIDERSMKQYLDSFAAHDELSRFMRSLRVAVLDDSKVILKIVSKILQLNGFTSVTLFEDPAGLLASPAEFDLYLTDMVLPGMTGEQVVTKLRERDSSAIIICMSQFAGEKPLAGILLAGANDYIQKPFDAVALITRLKVNVLSFQLKKRLELSAITDGLTGLFNHRHTIERLEAEIHKARRYNRSISVIMMDIDNFKDINDTRGHQGGDRVLTSIAETILTHVRETDLAGRYGGEEFLIVLPETDISAARKTAEKLRTAIAILMPITDGKPGVTVSAGIAEWIPGEDSGGIVHRADEHLYAAKRNGKNRVEG